LRPVASLVVVAASHSSAACGQHVPLSAARTCRGCDSRASNEPPFAGQRGVVEQSRPDAVHAPTSASLESVVSLRLQNREVLQQGFPCPIRRRYPKKIRYIMRDSIKALFTGNSSPGLLAENRDGNGSLPRFRNPKSE